MPQGSVNNTAEGQGVHREVKPEGLAEKYQAVTEDVNRSTKNEERSSLQYGYEGVTSLLIAPRYTRGRYGIEDRYMTYEGLVMSGQSSTLKDG
jgi:hypothetical protein